MAAAVNSVFDCLESARPQVDLDGDDRWMSIHNRFLGQVKSTEPEVMFFGDSHIALLEQSDFHRDAFAPLHCVCFGIRGDTTENVYWRMSNGELDFVKPKVVALLVGTNDGNCTVEHVLTNISAIVKLISSKQPQASIVVLKIPPRGQNPNPKRNFLAQINDQLPSILQHVPNCCVLDIDTGFVGLDGTISHLDMYDYLHFTNQGYKKAFEVVHSTIRSLIYPETE